MLPNLLHQLRCYVAMYCSHSFYIPLLFVILLSRSFRLSFFFFLNVPPPPEFYPLPLHAPLRIGGAAPAGQGGSVFFRGGHGATGGGLGSPAARGAGGRGAPRGARRARRGDARDTGASPRRPR